MGSEVRHGEVVSRPQVAGPSGETTQQCAPPAPEVQHDEEPQVVLPEAVGAGTPETQEAQEAQPAAVRPQRERSSLLHISNFFEFELWHWPKCIISGAIS